MQLSGISIATEKGQPRASLAEVEVTLNGLKGDRHAAPGLRQISILSETQARKFAEACGIAFATGGGKENLTVAGLEEVTLRPMDLLELGSCVLEITHVGKLAGGQDAALCSPESGCAMSERGVFARVRKPGPIQLDMPLNHHPRRLTVRIVTLSDRASQGEYEDRSGPRVLELLEAFGQQRGWQIEGHREVIPDAAEKLEALLVEAREKRVDLVITTGSTGMGPRDIAPEVICDHADRIIPGIMEHTRLKYGASRPLALLSRSVAATFGRTLVFALPGSPKAVEEYLHEITQVLEHLIYVTRGLDPHGA